MTSATLRAFGLLAVFLLSFAVACQDPASLPTQPTVQPSNPSPPPPPPPPVPPEPVILNVGDEIDQHIDSASGRTYSFTAPNSGTLVLDVSYDAFFWDVILEIQIGTSVSRPTADPWSPVVARVPVTSGQTYNARVGIAGYGWQPIANYKLKVSME